MSDEDVSSMTTACEKNTEGMEFRSSVYSTFINIHHLTDEFLILEPDQQTYLLATEKLAKINREIKKHRKLAKEHFGESQRTRRRPPIQEAGQ